MVPRRHHGPTSGRRGSRPLRSNYSPGRTAGAVLSSRSFSRSGSQCERNRQCFRSGASSRRPTSRPGQQHRCVRSQQRLFQRNCARRRSSSTPHLVRRLQDRLRRSCSHLLVGSRALLHCVATPHGPRPRQRPRYDLPTHRRGRTSGTR